MRAVSHPSQERGTTRPPNREDYRRHRPGDEGNRERGKNKQRGPGCGEKKKEGTGKTERRKAKGKVVLCTSIKNGKQIAKTGEGRRPPIPGADASPSRFRQRPLS